MSSINIKAVKSKPSFINNVSFGVLAKVFSHLTSLITVMYVTRILKPEIYGDITFSFSVAGY